MATTRTIAIIGALEEKGREAIQALADKNYRLLLFYKATGELAAAQPQLDKEWISCPVEACWEADIILIAAPPEEHAKLAADIKAVATGKPVIILGKEDETGNKLVTALPHSHVISACPDKLEGLLKNL